MTILTLAALQADLVERVGEGIGPGALVFMLISMGAVLTLTAWCYLRILKTRGHFDPDGVGPARPPVPGEAEDGGERA